MGVFSGSLHGKRRDGKRQKLQFEDLHMGQKAASSLPHLEVTIMDTNMDTERYSQMALLRLMMEVMLVFFTVKKTHGYLRRRVA